MNWEKVSANWERYEGMIRARWSFLTQDDMAFIGGDYDRLVGRLEYRYGISNRAARDWVEGFLAGLDKAA